MKDRGLPEELCRTDVVVLAIQYTGTIVQRFEEIRVELQALNDAASLDDFTTLWLPPNEQTALLAQAVVEHSEGLETVEQLFESLQQEFNQYPSQGLQLLPPTMLTMYTVMLQVMTQQE